MECHKASRFWGSDACEVQPGTLLFLDIYVYVCVDGYHLLWPNLPSYIYLYCCLAPSCYKLIGCMFFTWYWEIDLVCFLTGHSNSRIPWKLLQAHSNRYWPACGLYLFVKFLIFILLVAYYIFNSLVMSVLNVWVCELSLWDPFPVDARQ